jgi:heme exporter protein CcmD
MIEFLNMGGYAFYVWTSFSLFIAAIMFDSVSLNIKEKRVKRNIKSMLKRKANKNS